MSLGARCVRQLDLVQTLQDASVNGRLIPPCQTRQRGQRGQWILFGQGSFFPQFGRLPFQDDPSGITYQWVRLTEGCPNFVESAWREFRPFEQRLEFAKSLTGCLDSGRNGPRTVRFNEVIWIALARVTESDTGPTASYVRRSPGTSNRPERNPYRSHSAAVPFKNVSASQRYPAPCGKQWTIKMRP